MQTGDESSDMLYHNNCVRGTSIRRSTYEGILQNKDGILKRSGSKLAKKLLRLSLFCSQSDYGNGKKILMV
jgi:hypothetical protein